MAHNLATRARKLAWKFHEDKQAPVITQIRRVGTDSTLNDDDASSMTTSIRRISASGDIDRFASALKKDGCVIVENFTDLQSLHKSVEEVQPWLEAHESQVTQASTPLIKQSPTIRNSMYAHAVYQELCEEFLAVETTRWKNGRLTTELRQPILSSASTNIVQSSGSTQQFNRYDLVLGLKHERVDHYQHGRDAMLGLVIPSTETVRVNVVLGSHLFGGENSHAARIAVEEEVKAGEALIVLGSLYHYITADPGQEVKTKHNLVHLLWSCAGIYRPEEQSSLLISAAEMNTYPSVVQERLR